MSDQFNQPQKRALQYWYVDGAYEIGFGLLCLILAAYFHLEKILQGSWLSALADGSLVLVLIGGVALINWLTRRWKERVTFPRTGYVAYRREAGLRRQVRIALGLAVGMLIGGTVAALVMQPFQSLDMMPLASGLLMGMVLAILAWRSFLPRLYLVAGVSAAAGLSLAFAGLGNHLSLAVFYLVFGISLIASGLVTLRRYLRQNPAEKDETEACHGR